MADEEARLRAQLDAQAPGSEEQRALQTELADLLLDRGELEQAMELYTAVLAARLPEGGAREAQRPQPAAPSGNGGHGGQAPAMGVPDAASWEAADAAWEEDDAAADVSRLSLADAAAASPRPARTPPAKRPDRAVYVPAKQAAAAAAAAAKAEAAAARQAEAAAREAAAAENGARSAERRAPAQLAGPTRSGFARLNKRGAGEEPEAEQRVPLEGRHILEIVGIKRTDSEADLFAYLSGVLQCAIQPAIRWADDTHALAVFADPAQAAQMLQTAPEIGRLWLRPYALASGACRAIAASELRPPTARPRTTAVVARRLLSNALQNRELRDLAGESDLKAQRQEKRAAKERRQQDLDAAWGDP